MWDSFLTASHRHCRSVDHKYTQTIVQERLLYNRHSTKSHTIKENYSTPRAPMQSLRHSGDKKFVYIIVSTLHYTAVSPFCFGSVVFCVLILCLLLTSPRHFTSHRRLIRPQLVNILLVFTYCYVYLQCLIGRLFFFTQPFRPLFYGKHCIRP